MRTKSNQLLWAVVDAARQMQALIRSGNTNGFDCPLSRGTGVTIGERLYERTIQTTRALEALDAAPWVAVGDTARACYRADEEVYDLSNWDNLGNSREWYRKTARAAMRAMGCGEGEK